MVVSSKIPVTKLENQDIGIGICALIGWFCELCRLRPDEPKNPSAFVETEDQFYSTMFSRNVADFSYCFKQPLRYIIRNKISRFYTSINSASLAESTVSTSAMCLSVIF